ncbi:hypothetical protein [Aeromonas rivipollensis]|uniref:hypothetical protein n=1 Tax=Aeromonas rivipollensis TaxID=948519 RepID=UPI003D262E8C
MNIYIAVVSHGHSELINRLSCLSSLVEKYQVVVKSNKYGDDFNGLLANQNFKWIDSQYGCGFGRNNNIIFNYCCSSLGMSKDDCFIVLNPDVVISIVCIERLAHELRLRKTQLSAINLFKDTESTNYDNSVRKFPSLLQFIRSFLGLGNTSIIDKDKLTIPSKVDWAAGSFLAFRAGHYAALGGFDENYFMYCEDIDICYRSHLLGESVTYYPEIKALHLAQHANRKFFSKHFYWHLTSAIRFLFTKMGLRKAKSSLSSSFREI